MAALLVFQSVRQVGVQRQVLVSLGETLCLGACEKEKSSTVAVFAHHQGCELAGSGSVQSPPAPEGFTRWVFFPPPRKLRFPLDNYYHGSLTVVISVA